MNNNGSNSPKLSVIVVVYNMRRAAPRSIRSLTTPYQRNIGRDEYEVIVVENGSSQPLNEIEVVSSGANVKYFHLIDAPPSPAYAINFGVSHATGDVLCIMVDGAHLVTPGVLSYGLALFASLQSPVVLTQRFFLGRGQQTETIFQGYDETEEDELLESVGWPEDGYRLFEIGVPYEYKIQGKTPKLFWFVRLFESNSIFMRKETYERIGGCNEKFDFPGGGILIPDLYRELARLDDVQLVQLIGEGSFHQLHGGVSTSVSKDNQREQWELYLRQYEEIRGEPYEVTKKPLRYYGHIPTARTRRLMLSE